jgi:hypothetical protein
MDGRHLIDEREISDRRQQITDPLLGEPTSRRLAARRPA